MSSCNCDIIKSECTDTQCDKAVEKVILNEDNCVSKKESHPHEKISYQQCTRVREDMFLLWFYETAGSTSKSFVQFRPKIKRNILLRAVLKETNQRKTKLVDFEDTKGNDFSEASTDKYLTEKQLKEDCSLKVANLLSFTNFVQNSKETYL